MRAAFRFFAAAIEAFLARADRSSGVMFLADVLPPLAPICAMAARNRSRESVRMPTIVPYRLGTREIVAFLGLDILPVRCILSSVLNAREMKVLDH